MVGFDRRETITIPPLARLAMLPNFRRERPAARYRT
jgi:hypothetical protein